MGVNLKKIFVYYAKLSAKKLSKDAAAARPAADWRRLGMRTLEVCSMLKDCRLVGNSLTQKSLDLTLNKVGKDEEGLLDYSHFCEALAAVACLKNPDPYVPLKAKITIFVSL